MLVYVAGGKPTHAADVLPDPMTNPGFVEFYNNEYDQAIDYFSRQVTAHPKDPEEYNHLAQAILYQEMFRNGSLESQLVSGNNAFLRREKMTIAPATRQRFQDCLNRSLALSADRLAANPKDARAQYQQASAHALRATYNFLVEKAWVDSLKEAAAARRASESALEADPDFLDARLIPAVYSYVVGNLPFYMRALGFLGGFHGDKTGGLEQLRQVAAHGVSNKYDADILLAVIYRREHQPRLAIPLLETLARQFPRNVLFRFEQVQMYSDLGDKAAALRVLETITSLRASGTPGYAQLPMAKIRFASGNLHFWYNDLPLALDDFRFVTQQSKELDLNAELIGWLRLGQTSDLQGRHTEAVSAYRRVMELAPGSEVANEAKGYIDKSYRRKTRG